MIDETDDDEIEEVYRQQANDEVAWNKLHEDIPQTLYHYTTATGVQGIISSRRMLATHIRYMNDSSELIYANTYFQALLKQEAKRYKSKIITDFLRQVGFMLSRFEEFYDVYVACFCEEDDLLSQWRAYGSSGGGYAIGLRLQSVRVDQSRRLFLRRVIYDLDKQNQLVRSLVTTICQATDYRVAAEGGGNQDKIDLIINDSINLFIGRAVDLLYSFKSPTFKEEKEWRLAYTLSAYKEDAHRGFRVSGGGIVPYTSFNITTDYSDPTSLLPIERIRFGPTLHPSLAKKSLEMLLDKYGYKGVVIEGSQIPLRA